MVELFANNEDPDQTPISAASDLGVSSLHWVKGKALLVKNVSEMQDRGKPCILM